MVMRRNRSIRHKIRALSVLIVSIIIFCFLAYEYHDKTGKELIFDIVIIFAAIVIPDRFGDVFKAFESDEERDEVNEYFYNLPAYLRDAHDIICFPTRWAGLEYCVRVAKSATHIKNTSLRYGKRQTTSKDDSIDSSYHSWIDARRQAALGSCEVTEILSKYLKADDPVRKYAVELSADSIRYRFNKLDDVANPMVQMTIFDFDDHKEVVFGWELPGHEEARSFLSRNSRLVDYLEHYFQYNYSNNSNESWYDEDSTRNLAGNTDRTITDLRPGT